MRSSARPRSRGIEPIIGLAISCAIFCAIVGAIACGAAAGVAAEGGTVERIQAFRAEHMVLDVVSRGSLILAGTQSGEVDVFDWRQGRKLEVLMATEVSEGQKFAPTVQSVAVSPSERLCAVITSDGKLRVLRLEEVAESGGLKGEPVFTLERPGLMVARFVGEGQVLVGDMRGELALVDLAERRELYRRQLEYDPIYEMVISPDAERAALGFRSSRVRIVDPQSGEVLQVLKGHRDAVYGVAWLGDDRLATAGKDKHLYVWDLRQADPAPKTLYAGDDYITALGSDPAGGRLALTVDDNDVALYDLADGRISHRMEGHSAPVQSLVFFEGGSRLVSAGNDARIHVWALDVG
ncbi:MAG: PQQ-binding-like beta-propeller repeat protein, partial [Deltaproteobacteria bacterium]|nr:PQQ-binding-like beta-propeller repeat protein [Deltaproteobacteria bacterium]